MGTLYELTQEYAYLYELLSQGEIDEQAVKDSLEGMDWGTEFETKAENYAKIIKQLEADAKASKAEKDRLVNRERAFTNNADRLKVRLQEAMQMTNREKFKTALYSFNIGKYTSVYVDEEVELPEQYTRVKTEPDKTTIKEALKNGETIPGCALIQTRSLSIR